MSRLLAAHLQALRRSPVGPLRRGRQQLVALLSQVPCLSQFDSGEADSGRWWVSFELDINSRIAWRVVSKLGLLLNRQSGERLLPTVFRPIPGEWPAKAMRWEIASTAPRLEPADVERWLRENLPQPLGDEQAWIEEG